MKGNHAQEMLEEWLELQLQDSSESIWIYYSAIKTEPRKDMKIIKNKIIKTL